VKKKRDNPVEDRSRLLLKKIEKKLGLLRQRAKDHPHILAPLFEIGQLLANLKREVEEADEKSNWSVIASLLVMAWKVLESIYGK